MCCTRSINLLSPKILMQSLNGWIKQFSIIHQSVHWPTSDILSSIIDICIIRRLSLCMQSTHESTVLPLHLLINFQCQNLCSWTRKNAKLCCIYVYTHSVNLFNPSEALSLKIKKNFHSFCRLFLRLEFNKFLWINAIFFEYIPNYLN